MTDDEKKEYTKLKRKFSRGNEKEKTANIRKEKVAKHNAKKRANESE